MNIKSLRIALKSKWMDYYQDNRHWITRLGVWGTYQGKRRPSSSFILGALSVQEPRLMEILPLVVDLNNNPDRIVVALGLNFNPEDELEAFNKAKASLSKQALKMLPSPKALPIDLVKHQPLIKQAPSQVPSARIPLDTAQLSIHEQPDRGSSI